MAVYLSKMAATMVEPKITIILLANNIVVIIHLFEYNKYQISTFLFFCHSVYMLFRVLVSEI